MGIDSSVFNSIVGLVLPIGRLTPGGVSLLGTAFLSSVGGTFVAAFHLIGHDDTGLQLILPQTSSLSDYQHPSPAQLQAVPLKLAAHDPFHDLCLLKADSDSASNIVIGGSDDMAIGDDVVCFGFPHSNHGRMVLTYERSYVGAKVLIPSSGLNAKHIIMNTQARPGQSGSPIFRKSDLRLVGVLIGSYAPGGGGLMSMGGVDPQTLHQTTHAVSAEYIKDMLQ